MSMRHLPKTAPTAPVASATRAALADENADLDPDPSAGYAADHAALAFGIPRIAPVLVQAVGGLDRPIGHPPGFAAEVEDLTESLIADEQQAAAVFPSGKLGELAGGSELSDPVTAALRLPCRRPQTRTVWSGPQRLPLTERLTVPSALGGPRLTAVLPPVSRGPAEAATTTVTLPAALPSALFAGVPGGRPSLRQPTRRILFCGGALLVVAIVGLVCSALPRVGPGAAPSPLVRHRDGLHRERLLEQAVAALRDGRPEQAIPLLLRYQSGQLSGERDRTVDLMLRVLRTNSSAPLTAR